MATKLDPRSPRKKAKDATYAALPALRVHRPMRAIKNAFGDYAWQTEEAKALHKQGGVGMQKHALQVL